MSFDPNGVWRSLRPGPADLFAVVIYIPDPLGKFLDDLRRELVPGCRPHAHVSVLPPRFLAGEVATARGCAAALAAEFPPFEIAAGAVQVFEKTDVIYIDVLRGADELRRMHDVMASGALLFEEPYTYHPHITLAQDIHRRDVRRLGEEAAALWQQYTGPRSFRAETIAFVRSSVLNQWVDLAEFPLRVAQAIR